MKQITIFTGLTPIEKVMVGQAQDFMAMAKLLMRKKHKVKMIIPNDYHATFTEQYQEKNLSRIVNNSKAIILGSFAPASPIISAFQKKVPVVLQLFEPAAITALELKDYPSQNKNQILVDYNIAALKLHLFCADFVLFPSEAAKNFYLGILASIGRLNLWIYSKSKNYSLFMQQFSHGIEEKEPKHKRNIYKGVFSGVAKNDKIILWNGGIWNWYDPYTLICAMKYLEKTKKIKLIFQGYKHPEKKLPPTSTALRAIALAKKLKVYNKNAFFFASWLPHQDRESYLKETDLGIITCPDILDARFGLRNRIFDYLWAETPLVISSPDVFAEEVEKFNLGLVVPPKNPFALAEAIKKLLGDKKLYQQCQKNMRAYKKRFYYKKTLQPLVDFCQKPHLAPDKGKLPLKNFSCLLADFRQKEKQLKNLK